MDFNSTDTELMALQVKVLNKSQSKAKQNKRQGILASREFL
jgi:hypothetical protein